MTAETPPESARALRFFDVWSAWRSGFAKVVGVALAMLVVLSPVRSGTTSTPAKTAAKGDPLGRVVDWVLAHGVSKTVSAPVAEALDFGTAEIRVKQQGYQSDDKLARLVAVPVDGSGNIIFCHLSLDGSGVCWRTDTSGVLQATARLGTTGQAMRVSATASEREDFETQKSYFIKKFAR